MLALDTTRVLWVNYEGVVNGDFFDENPVTKLTELRDVTLDARPKHGDVLFYDSAIGEFVNEPIHSALGGTSAKAVITGSVSGGDTSNVTLTFSGAYPYTTLPSNNMYVMRGTLIAYDYGTTGTSGHAWDVTGGPRHEISSFSAAWFNLDDVNTTGPTNNYLTGSFDVGSQVKSGAMHSFLDWTTGGSTDPSDTEFEGNWSAIDFSTGDITVNFEFETKAGTDKYFGITAWLEFLGGDELPPT